MTDKKQLLDRLGCACQLFRMKIGYTQRQVAYDTEYTVENVSRFERGLNNNALILAWYVNMGFDIGEVL